MAIEPQVKSTQVKDPGDRLLTPEELKKHKLAGKKLTVMEKAVGNLYSSPQSILYTSAPR